VKRNWRYLATAQPPAPRTAPQCFGHRSIIAYHETPWLARQRFAAHLNAASGPEGAELCLFGGKIYLSPSHPFAGMQLYGDTMAADSRLRKRMSGSTLALPFSA